MLFIESRKECDKYAPPFVVLLDRVKTFTDVLTSIVRGKDAKHSSNKELIGGALIRHVFTDVYSKVVDAIISSLKMTSAPATSAPS